MTGRMVERLLRLTGRERLLLGVMALVLLLGAGVGLLWPLAERRAASAAALEEARALSAWVAARAEDARVLRSAAGPGPAEPIGLAAAALRGQACPAMWPRCRRGRGAGSKCGSRRSVSTC